MRLFAVFIAIFTTLFWGCANPGQVREVDVHSNTTFFFVKDRLTGADYLALLADGSYRLVSAEHLFIEEFDRGNWQARNSVLVLKSTRRPREISTPALQIYLRDSFALQRLPQLRAKLAALLTRDARPLIPANDVKEVSVSLPKGYRLHANITTEFEIADRTAVSRDELRQLIAAVGTYLKSGEMYVRAFRLLHYAEVEWLQAATPNDEPAPSRVADVVKWIHQNPGSRPEREYVRVSADEFARHAGNTYPFKYFPEMTEKVRALRKQN